MNREEFRQRLKELDWTYEYSDDPRVYRENAELHDVIHYAMNERSRQGKDDFFKMYNAENPFRQE
jgi:hypothetical protein